MARRKKTNPEAEAETEEALGSPEADGDMSATDDIVDDGIDTDDAPAMEDGPEAGEAEPDDDEHEEEDSVTGDEPEKSDPAEKPDVAEEGSADPEDEDSVGDDDADAEYAGEDNGEAEDGEDGDGPVTALPMTAIVEALLFAAREPLKLAQIARAVGKRTRQEAVREAIDELNVQYLESARAFEIAEISGRYQLMSRPEYAEHIMRIYPKREVTDKDKTQRLTPAMLDTLAIIAYKQPVMRSEIEHIRGVSCSTALRALIERGSVREMGRRSDLVGKPAVFGTTERFLAEFGLGSLDELPMRSEFMEPGGPPPVELVVTDAGGDDGETAPESEPVVEEPASEGFSPGAEEAVEENVEETAQEAEGEASEEAEWPNGQPPY